MSKMRGYLEALLSSAQAGKQVSVLAVTAFMLFANTSPARSADDVPVSLKPFHAAQLEVTRGGTLMLRPRIVYVDGLPDDEYTLVLDLPAFLSQSKTTIAGTDMSGYTHVMRIDAVEETAGDVIVNGKERKAISYRPDMTSICDAIDLCFGYKNSQGAIIDYVPILKFLGTFDWKVFTKEITCPTGAYAAQPLLLKWPMPFNSAYGKLSVRSLQVKEADTGKVVFSWADAPIVVSSENATAKLVAYVQSKTRDNLSFVSVPGARYIVSCEAKGEGIRSDHMVSTDILKKDELRYYTRTFIFDVAPNAVLPDQIKWMIKDRAGKTCREGQVSLVEAPKYQVPKRIETSVWVAETALQSEAMPVQELFLDKFHEWGFNTVMPALDDMDITAPHIDYAMPIAQEAKSRGMKVRIYISQYWRMEEASKAYCAAHPECASITWEGDAVPGPRVCFTHILDGGKYDAPPNAIPGGKANPWLSCYLKVLKTYVQTNNLDGVWIDHEYPAAPYRKAGISNYWSTGAKLTRWQPCFCERCRNALKEFAGLDHVPTGKECGGAELYDNAVDFKCDQNIRLWRLCRDAVKEVNPNATFGIYSGSPLGGVTEGGKPDQYDRENYGVDWTKAASSIDIASVRIVTRWPAYTNALHEFLARGVKSEKEMPTIIHSLYTPFYSSSSEQDTLTYPEFKNNIVSLVVKDGSVGGWSFTGIWGMDDQLTKPIREANDLLAKYEDFLADGRRADGEVNFAQPDTIGATWRLKERLITFVFNTSGAQAKMGMSLAKPGSARVSVDVPAHDCRVYIWN